MSKRICFLYTETNGLHQTHENVSKKKLFAFARLVTLNYEIGYISNNKYIQEKKIRHIVKPKCMYITPETIIFHGITQEFANTNGIDPEIIINELKNNLVDVNIIVSHNVDFHLKTILAESIRHNINLDISKKMIFDTVSFYHKYGPMKLKDLAKKLGIIDQENDTLTNNKNNVELIKNTFFKLYDKFKKSLKS
jgi:DNA polymerase III epsilon subunit-like protein